MPSIAAGGGLPQSDTNTTEYDCFALNVLDHGGHVKYRDLPRNCNVWYQVPRLYSYITPSFLNGPLQHVYTCTLYTPL